MTRLGRNIRNAFAGLVLAASSVGVAQANLTVDVTIDDTRYEVSTLFGSFNNINATNNDILKMQPWYAIGDGGDLAGDFAAAVGADLGTPNQLGGGAFVGPVFAVFQSQAGEVFGRLLNPNNGFISFPRLTANNPNTWAVATEVAAPNPIPLPAAAFLLLGGLGALGVIRRYKGRTA